MEVNTSLGLAVYLCDATSRSWAVHPCSLLEAAERPGGGLGGGCVGLRSLTRSLLLSATKAECVMGFVPLLLMWPGETGWTC